MKLQAGNPNLMKKKAMRVNNHTTLTSFPRVANSKDHVKEREGYVPVERDPNLMNKAPFDNLTGDKAHAKYRTGFVPAAKDPNAVPPPSLSLWHQPVYKPENLTPMRPGADDHLKFKSVGNLT